MQLEHKVVPWSRTGIFRNEHTDPPNWTLNSCFGAFRSILVHLAMFRYYTKLCAKWVELVQLMHKFVPWSPTGIFYNKRTRSTPLDPKLMFLCVSYCLGVLVNVSLLHETWCKTGWTGAINAQVCAVNSFWNFSQRMHPTHSLDPKLMFWCVS